MKFTDLDSIIEHVSHGRTNHIWIGKDYSIADLIIDLLYIKQEHEDMIWDLLEEQERNDQ